MNKKDVIFFLVATLLIVYNVRLGALELPNDQYIWAISDYFNSKSYEANSRFYDRVDLTVPERLEDAIENIGIPYLRLLRNEIFARHGYQFKDPLLAKIFKETNWYQEREEFNFNDLNAFEGANVKYIELMESSLLIQAE
ncbi:MAG: YARHG domain-containing protein [Candidatus Edwardsbacteria bacterium]